MKGVSSRRWAKTIQQVLTVKGDICWICGHPGATSADHVIERDAGGALYDLDNLEPVHHHPCPTCGVRCNYRRGAQYRNRKYGNVAGSYRDSTSKSTLIYGPPCSGKTTLAFERYAPGDIVLDVDRIGEAITGLDHDYPLAVLPFVMEARDSMLKRWGKSHSVQHLYVVGLTPTIADRNKLRDKVELDDVLLIDPGQATCHLRAVQAQRPERWHGLIDEWYAKHEPDHDVQPTHTDDDRW